MNKLKNLFFAFFVLFPSVCCGFDLNTKFAWEAWAVNSALMNFCMPQLQEGTSQVAMSRSIFDKSELRKIGNIPVALSNYNKGGQLEFTAAPLMPKCNSFVEKFLAQRKKNVLMSLNDIISICLDTIEDKLVCESMVLSLLYQSEQAIATPDKRKLEQKIKNSVQANHIICSEDGLFCTTYNQFSDGDIRPEKLQADGDGEVIYDTQSGNSVVGFCAGVKRSDAERLYDMHENSRCIVTDSKYNLYQFDIQDASDGKILLVYVNYADVINGAKKFLDKTSQTVAQIESCYKKNDVAINSAGAMKANHSMVALETCEKDNSDKSARIGCEIVMLKHWIDKFYKELSSFTLESVDNNLEKYKAKFQSKFVSILALGHQTDLLLQDSCEN